MNKLSIVTPVFNSEAYLSETIESVIFQKGDFEIEYIIVDGCSTDNSLEIAQSYQSLLEEKPWLIQCHKVTMTIISEKDDGMYDAINKGFEVSSGNICAYLNADDIYLSGALNTISRAFNEFPEIEWLKGITSYINKDSILYKRGECHLYNRDWIQKGVYGTSAYFIRQDSVFWRTSLWQQAGPIDNSLRLAGDFYLWIRFSQWATLYSLDVQVSCFRKLENQLSSDIQKYYSEVSRIQSSKLSRFEKIKLKLFFLCNQLCTSLICKAFLGAFYRLLFPGQKNSVITVDEKSNFRLSELNSFLKR